MKKAAILVMVFGLGIIGAAGGTYLGKKSMPEQSIWVVNCEVDNQPIQMEYISVHPKGLEFEKKLCDTLINIHAHNN